MKQYLKVAAIVVVTLVVVNTFIKRVPVADPGSSPRARGTLLRGGGKSVSILARSEERALRVFSME